MIHESLIEQSQHSKQASLLDQFMTPKQPSLLSTLDDIKDEVSMYKTTYLNKRNKELVGYLLSNIKNLHLSL